MSRLALSFLACLTLPLSAACKSEETNDGPYYAIDKLKNPETCKECHADHYKEWSGSMHAYASKDPVFRAMNARGQEETHGELGQFCVKCHAPMAVEDGLVNDGGTNLDAVPEEDQGITCYFCHNVSDVHGTSNNPLVLAHDDTMRGRYRDPLKNKAHRGAYSDLHDGTGPTSSKLCGSCHDIVVPAHFSGAPSDQHLERTFEEWTSSVFSNVNGGSPNSCGSCHMRADRNKPIADYPGVPSRDTRHHHEFPGVDVALTDFPERDAQLALVQDFLSTSLLVKLCVSNDGLVQVSIENLTGHNFPSGASQDRRVWIELRGYSDENRQQQVFSRGILPASGDVTDLLQSEPDLWLLRDVTTDKNGKPAHMFWDVANIEPKTILARVTNDPTANGYHQEAPTPRLFDAKVTFGALKEVTLKIRVQPVGTDVLRDLVRSGHLPGRTVASPDAGGGSDAGSILMPAIEMPIHDYLPNKDAGELVTVDWTPQRGVELGERASFGVQPTTCLSTAAKLPPP